MNNPDVITLKDLLTSIWRVKYGVLLGGIIGILIAYFALQNITPKYEASMIIGPVSTDNQGLQDIVLRNKRTAFIKDILRQAVPSGQEQFDTFEHLLTSSNTAKNLAKNPDTMRNVFYKKWNTQTNTWIDKLSMTQRIEAFFNTHQNKTEPQAEDLKKKLHHYIQFNPVGVTDFKRVTYRHPNPNFAQKLLKILYTDTDQMMRRQSQFETQTRIAYLQENILKVRNSEHRDILISLLKEQERTKLVTAVDLPYAARVLENPNVSGKPVSPNIWLTLIMLLFGGGIIGGFMHSIFAPIKTS